MTVTDAPAFAFDNTFARDLVGLYERWEPAAVPAPDLLVLNDALAVELGLDPDALRSPAGVDVLVGNAVPPGATPLAQAYSGHQFGGLSPRLGDGRAVLLGEIVDRHGRRRDLHLKGSGRTPFARGGDGKAAVGPMLREHVIGEAMHALGVPTTRALAVVATGEPVRREVILPGAVLARVAASHLRVGTFQYAALSGDRDLLERLTRYAIDRHHPQAADAPVPALGLLDAVVTAQAELVARWMEVGFIHGVMNTDNATISGETIDYGPCAFLDVFDPATVFSSIDHGGRYAYGNQPSIAHWNLARLAEALLAIVDDDQEQAVAAVTEVLDRYPDRFRAAFHRGMAAKLGLATAGDQLAEEGDADLVEATLLLLRDQEVDLTGFFRSLSAFVRGDRHETAKRVAERAAFDAWADRYQARLDRQGRPADDVAAAMDRVNPLYIPRNHLVEESLEAAVAGDLGPYEQLVDVLVRPFDERPGLARYTRPAPPDFTDYQTFCGT